MIIPRQWQQFQKLGNQWVFIFVNCIREIRLRRIPKTRGLSLTSTSSRCDCLNFPAGLTHPSSSPAPRENEDSSPSHFQTEVGRGWQGFPGGSDGKESTCNTKDLSSIPGSGRPPGGGHGSPLQYSCLENPMDRGAWCATVHGVMKNWKQLSNSTRTTGGPKKKNACQK